MHNPFLRSFAAFSNRESVKSHRSSSLRYIHSSFINPTGKSKDTMNSETVKFPSPSVRRGKPKYTLRIRDPLRLILPRSDGERGIKGIIIDDRRKNNQSLLDNLSISKGKKPETSPMPVYLSSHKRSKKVTSTLEVMKEAMQQVINSGTCLRKHSHLQRTGSSYNTICPIEPYLPQSSCANSSSTLRDSDDRLKRWGKIYINYLKSSPNPKEFAFRLQDLINKRLPKRLSEHIAFLHSTHNDLSHLVSTDSYNELIKFFYRANKYHRARGLLEEMVERGIDKDCKTRELIMCSYQALNKFKGVELTLEAMKSVDEFYPDCWIHLFSIRPRRHKDLQHFDSMDQASKETRPGEPMTARVFLAGWRWNIKGIYNNGMALVNLSKRMMESNQWEKAYILVDTALALDANSRSLIDGSTSRLQISPYWATSLLNTLIFGLYNIKQASKRSSKNQPQSKSNIDPLKPTFVHQFKASISNDAVCDQKTLEELLSTIQPMTNVFKFIDFFLERHRCHRIQVSPSLLLNSLRLKTCLPPSTIKLILKKWIENYGLDQKVFGSRLGVRLIHVISSWFANLLRGINLSLSSPSCDSNRFDPKIYCQLYKEYNSLIELWNGADCSIPSLKAIILRGPIDGRSIRGRTSFYSAQKLNSIKIGIKRLSQLRKKLKDLEPYEKKIVLNAKDLCDQKQAKQLLGEEDPFNEYFNQICRYDPDGFFKKLAGEVVESELKRLDWEKGLLIESSSKKKNYIKTLYKLYPEKPGLKPICLRAATL
ncbi:expressed protein [Phakopsora pachyrhizi]|uniref:Expressed protein n=1 Tax=Phakopsora pachyrhizi TaxID=170000 RepID=A0AAV0AKE4_PHAPC|nr:expressed protein [Phakopsora pachyrhizi]